MADKAIKVMNRRVKPGVPVINTPAGMYAPDWDDPKVQADRVLKREQTPRLIGRGPSGLDKVRKS